MRSTYRLCLKLNRLLKDNEKVVYKDGNLLNDDIDNLTYKTFTLGEHPFNNYYISSPYLNKSTKTISINLYHKNVYSKKKCMSIARYKMCIKEKRILNKDEIVHRIDRNKLNDDINNLKILSFKENKKLEAAHKRKLTPKCLISCNGCNEDFILDLCHVKERLKKSISSNIFCSDYCRREYISNSNKIKKKKIIRYKCNTCNDDIYIPENATLTPIYCSHKCAKIGEKI